MECGAVLLKSAPFRFLFIFKVNFQQLRFAQLIALQALFFGFPVDQGGYNAQMCRFIQTKWILHIFPSNETEQSALYVIVDSKNLNEMKCTYVGRSPTSTLTKILSGAACSMQYLFRTGSAVSKYVPNRIFLRISQKFYQKNPTYR